MKDNKELVTVCVTTYNRKEQLSNAILSILTQTYTHFELLIIDDFSTDGTKELIENEIVELDYRIKYIRHTKNKGLAAARNTAILNAKGSFFTFMDDDDRWEKDFITNFMVTAKNYDSTYSFCASIISRDSLVKGINARIKELIILGYTPPVASQFYYTKILKMVGGYNEKVKSGVDHDLWIKLGKINLKLIWLNRKVAKPNQIKSNDRMTYNFKKRMTGIKNSMEIWKRRVGDQFGKDFFSCFEKNYQYNTYKKFIIFSLKEKKYKRVILYWNKLPKDLFLLDLKRYLKSKCYNNTLLIHPTFEKCTKKSRKYSSNFEIITE